MYADAAAAYSEALGKSLLFFEAQRSGKLPRPQRVEWRGDSGLLDRAADGRDLSGGWYTTGDSSAKASLPNAWAASVLAWSLYEFEDGYAKAGQRQAVLNELRWANDHFLQCLGNGTSVVAQVGSFEQDQCEAGGMMRGGGGTRAADCLVAVCFVLL